MGRYESEYYKNNTLGHPNIKPSINNASNHQNQSSTNKVKKITKTTCNYSNGTKMTIIVEK